MNNIKRIAVLFSVASLFAGSTAFGLTTDYSNYWSFDEGMGKTVADKVGGQHGTITGSSTGLGWTSGKSETALVMDGKDGEAIVLPDALFSGTSGTFTGWIKLESLSDRNVLLSGQVKGENSIYVSLYVDRDGRLTLKYKSTADGAENISQGSRLLVPNEWYHIVLSSDGSNYRVVVNGEAFTMLGSNTGKWFSQIAPSYVFQYKFGAGDDRIAGVFAGYLDEFRLYKRALSLDEAKALYDEENAKRPSVPVGLRPIISFTISDTQIPYGGSVALRWSAQKVSACSASGDWSGALALSGEKVITNIGSDSTYTLSCLGEGGMVHTTVAVKVGALNGNATTTASSTLPVLTVTQLNPATGAPLSSVASSLTLTRNLQLGARGDDVKNLQLFLIEKGYLGASYGTGYFGGLTKAAVIKFQKAKGLPSTGYVGLLTRAQLSAAN